LALFFMLLFYHLIEYLALFLILFYAICIDYINFNIGWCGKEKKY